MEQVEHRFEECRAAAIDLGASSGRVIVGVIEDGQSLSLHEVHRFENGLVRHGETLVWDMDKIVAQVEAGLVAAAEAGATTCAIDTWGVDYGLVDSDGSLLGPVVGYRDARTEGLAAALFEDGTLADAYERTGIPALDINTSVQIAAQVRDEGPLPADAQILMVPDLITFLLTGDRGTEASIASTTQLVDVTSKRWDAELLGRLGVDEAMVPAIRPPGSDAGEVRLGDHAGMHMVRACEHDTASAVASIGLEPGDAFISCGTWSLVGVARDTPLATLEALAAGLSNESGPDASTLLLANCTGLWIAQQLKIEMEESLGRGLTWQGIAEEVRASHASTFLFDTEDPSLARPGNMLGKLERLAREEGIEGDLGIAALFGSVYESLARQYAQVIERLQRVTGEPVERIRVIGGGSRNAVLCQMVADECGLPIIAGPAEASAVGNLLVQFCAQGAFCSLEDARRVVGPSLECGTYLPRAASDL